MTHDLDAVAAEPLLVLELPTPAGTLAVAVAPEDGTVRAAGFSSPADQLGRLDPAQQRRGTSTRWSGVQAAEDVAAAVAAYADGDVFALDAVRVAQPGGPFLQRAWEALRQVPPGATVSYRELAAAAGSPAAVRAAGSACARNLVAPFVPCHRVVRSDGSLGGYYYGLSVKETLLAHERANA
ncbi:MAG TPA: methylated-DNA--[protein]-cysteine S-methyltransferase [Motilibacteraceae bacterium]|nr:methylated-DNA--[protein]-cysteine S-methyltransferase [Motilibacteraceae bacterium]